MILRVSHSSLNVSIKCKHEGDRIGCHEQVQKDLAMSPTSASESRCVSDELDIDIMVTLHYEP